METILGPFTQLLSETEYEFVTKFPSAIWTEYGSFHVGFDNDWVYIERIANESHPQELKVYCSGAYRIIAKFAPNAWSGEYFSRTLPGWVDMDLALKVISSTYKTLSELPSGKAGKYLVGHFSIVTNERDALWLAVLRFIPVETIGYTPEVTLLLNNKESAFDGHPIQVWSDGSVSRKDCQAEPEIKTSKDILNLLKSAIGQAEWKEKWKSLLDIEVTNKEKSAQREIGNPGNLSGVKIERWTTNKGDLYILEYYWGYLGEDGDAGSDFYLYETKEQAVQKMKDMLSN